MKRIKNSDINFKINKKIVNLNNFSMRFFTVNSQAYFFIKDQDDLVSVERDATIYDEEVIISGGTKVIDYYLPLDWSELVQIGEGVLNFRLINNIDDPYFPDIVYNKVVEDSTPYYIDSDIHIEPSPDSKNLIERVLELEENLAVETADREDADVFLSGAVDTEIARAISAETALQEAIDELESGSSAALDAEIERAISAETALQDAIDDEEARAIAIENAIRQDLTDESELRSSADTAMWTAINDEIVRSTSAETSIENKVDVETLRAIAQENAISGNLETYKATNNAALQAETTRATSAETALQTAINDEATARANADTALQTAITNEVSRAREAESGITNSLNAEVIRATSAETALQTAINNEVTARENADTALDTKINIVSGNVKTEEARAIAQENAISGNLETYKASNNAALAAEVTRATSAETALQTEIDELSSGSSAAIDAEEARATSAETQLGNRIDAEASSREAADTAISGTVDTKLADKADKVDAVASAEYVSSAKTINFKNISGTVISTIDATDFIKDGMVDDVKIENGYLVITFNTDAGKESISIALTDIFNPNNYYTKTEIDNTVSGINTSIANEVSARTDADTAISGAVDTKLAINDFNTYSGAVDTVINSKASQSTVDTLSGTVTAHISDNSIHFTTGTVQSQIDSSISGKANSSDVYLKSETSGATEIATALAQKLAISDFNTYSGAVDTLISSKASQSDLTALSGTVTAHTSDNSIHFTTGTVETMITAATDDMATQTWVNNQGFLTEHQSLSAYSTTQEMNTAIDEATSGKANSSDVYLKSETSGSTEISTAIATINQNIEDNEEVTAQAFNVLNAELANKLDASAYTPVDLSNYYQKSETSGATELATAFAATQPKLSAGTGISIDANNVISTTGGGSITIDPTLDSGSTNPVANSAITTAINEKVSISDNNFSGYSHENSVSDTWVNLYVSSNSVRTLYLSGTTGYGGQVYVLTNDFGTDIATFDFDGNVPTNDYCDITYNSATSSYTITIKDTYSNSYITEAYYYNIDGGKLWCYDINIASGQSASVLNQVLPYVYNKFDDKVDKSDAIKYGSLSFYKNGNNSIGLLYENINKNSTTSSFEICDNKGIVMGNDTSALSLGDLNTISAHTRDAMSESNYIFKDQENIPYSAAVNSFVATFKSDLAEYEIYDFIFRWRNYGGIEFLIKKEEGNIYVKCESTYVSIDWTTDYSSFSDSMLQTYGIQIGVSQTGITYTKGSSNQVYVYSVETNYGLSNLFTSVLVNQNKINIYDAVDTLFANYETGGTGGGISSAECQTMIDQSISGKANSSDVYTKSETSGATEISTALASKSDTGHTHDDRYYTETEINNRLGGLTFWKGTQSAYDNLQTKDNNTLYVIVG